ncbi:hypothetical protein CBM2599_B51096 [Cupriavidus taiwanensis]|uniref:hypothetical protein n=1 Tax=Cupriavidus taiwanensis TaxID=164546 RepID=UPI000E13A03B|nr:hypothetical protein [Cupriavidus taiwanensis]SOY97350.1 hypothetical protein CBM2599_B51096 [Cupriavidus taiwanensis]SOZ00080.1 hypothetical protein CBM2600_B70106 [Cupriavidus taiwanensis]
MGGRKLREDNEAQLRRLHARDSASLHSTVTTSADLELINVSGFFTNHLIAIGDLI